MRSRVKRSVAAMAGYQPGEQPRAPGVIKLNTNENPYPPSPRVAAALAQFNAERLRLYPDPVSRELRTVIARLHGVGAEHVFVGNGSDEILALATRAFVEDDGAIGYFNPSYSLYPVLAAIRGVRTAAVELGPEFEWAMPAGYDAALFLLANPNAPTSVRYPTATVQAFCRGFGGVVLIDEAYVDFAEGDCMALAQTLDNVLVMRTLSKSYSLAGLRLGYAVGPEELVGALFKIKDSYNVDTLAQHLAIAALSDPAHMRANAARIKQTRARLAAALVALGFKVVPSEANFLWVRPAGRNAAALCGALKGRGILVRHFPGLRTGDCVRISVGSDVEVDRLIEVLRALCGAAGVEGQP